MSAAESMSQYGRFHECRPTATAQPAATVELAISNHNEPDPSFRCCIEQEDSQGGRGAARLVSWPIRPMGKSSTAADTEC